MAGPDQPRKRRPNLLRCVIATVVGLIITVGIIALIFWLAVRPSPVEYTVEDAHIRGYNLTRGAGLKATFDITLRAHNRNRHVSIYYDSFDVSVGYADQALASAKGPTFFQPRRNVTVVGVEAVARGTALAGPATAGMKHDRTVGEVGLEVRVRARVRFKIGVIKTRHYKLKVYCAPVIVNFSNPSAFRRAYCDVDV